MQHLVFTYLQRCYCDVRDNAGGFNDNRQRNLPPTQKAPSKSKSSVHLIHATKLWICLKGDVGLHTNVNGRMVRLSQGSYGASSWNLGLEEDINDLARIERVC